PRCLPWNNDQMPVLGNVLESELFSESDEVGDQLRSALLSLRRSLGEHSGQQLRHPRAQLGTELTHVRWIVRVVLQQLLQRRAVGKRRLSREHIKERAAQRVNV